MPRDSHENALDGRRDDKTPRRTSQDSQDTNNSEFASLIPGSAQSIDTASTYITIPEIERAHTFHGHATSKSSMQNEDTFESSRIEYALSISKEEIQVLTRSGWAAKARRKGDKQQLAREIDIRYSTNGGILRAVLH